MLLLKLSIFIIVINLFIHVNIIMLHCINKLFWCL